MAALGFGIPPLPSCSWQQLWSAVAVGSSLCVLCAVVQARTEGVHQLASRLAAAEGRITRSAEVCAYTCPRDFLCACLGEEMPR